jgi:phosphatidylethanolamine-binding protein (PEBP) family uncharacterized protein
MSLSINYESGLVKGQNFTPLQTSLEPKVTLTGLDTNKFYTIIMYDRNASTPSHYYIHWVIVNIPGSDIIKGETVFKYEGPGPPKGTGQHLYTFVLYLQPDFNETWKSGCNEKDKYKSFQELLDKLSLTNGKIVGNEVKFVSEYVGGKKRRSTRSKKRSKTNRKRRSIRKR